MAAFRYDFDWDPDKASANFKKHGLDFVRAKTVFLDPLAVIIPDEDHRETETRWITLRMGADGRYALVIRTFELLANDRGRIRMISARRPTKAEIRDYEEHL